MRSIGGGAARQCGDQKVSVSLLFARGRHYGAERAIRWALPRISSSFIFRNIDRNFGSSYRPSFPKRVINSSPKSTGFSVVLLPISKLRVTDVTLEVRPSAPCRSSSTVDQHTAFGSITLNAPRHTLSLPSRL